MAFDVSTTGTLIAQVGMKSKVLEEIMACQDRDPSLCQFRDVILDDGSEYSADEWDVLCYKGRVVVPLETRRK